MFENYDSKPSLLRNMHEIQHQIDKEWEENVWSKMQHYCDYDQDTENYFPGSRILRCRLAGLKCRPFVRHRSGRGHRRWSNGGRPMLAAPSRAPLCRSESVSLSCTSRSPLYSLPSRYGARDCTWNLLQTI